MVAFSSGCAAYSAMGMALVVFGMSHTQTYLPNVEVSACLSGVAVVEFLASLCSWKARLYFEFYVLSVFACFWAALGAGGLLSILSPLPYPTEAELSLFYGMWALNCLCVVIGSLSQPRVVTVGWGLKAVGLVLFMVAGLLPNPKVCYCIGGGTMVVSGIVLFSYGWSLGLALAYDKSPMFELPKSTSIPMKMVRSTTSNLESTCKSKSLSCLSNEESLPDLHAAKKFTTPFAAGLLAFGVSNVYHGVIQYHGGANSVQYCQSFFFAGVLQYAIGVIMGMNGELIAISGFLVFGMYWWSTAISELVAFFWPTVMHASAMTQAFNNWMWSLFVLALGTAGYSNYQNDIFSNTSLYFMTLGNLLMGFFRLYPSAALMSVCNALFTAGGVCAWYYALAQFINDRWNKVVIPLGLKDLRCRRCR
ncbi:MAG: uncharacterized protein KVP18_002997 [Porospora cf. gigantea A]|uniref:uncharacterized protein n=1 Tax=Porospora cf. gigantea A TaxID=2853593 RepID=UPI00355A991D|nr:MAG: hypothetical protein KVP18_002997 [Porospora cf. gigantea A]